MFSNATVSSKGSSSRSGNSCGRNSSMPSLRMPNPFFHNKTSFNPLFRYSDAFTSFDASNFSLDENKKYRDKNHPILRKYNSHDSQANFMEVHLNSSGNTPDSTKSRSIYKHTPEISPESTEERNKRPELDTREFLEKYSLPRVVMVDGGEPLLLYRCFDSFTKVQAKGVVGKKGKEKIDSRVLHFPEGYAGWFSLTNDKGEKCAVTHTTILQLVRDQVCAFLSVQSFSGYTASNHDPLDSRTGKTQYLKTQIRGGQVFQLRAVFQHRDKYDGGRHSTKSSRLSRSARDKDLANRYAQLIGQNNQEFYVPLTTKGEFYEIYTSMKARLCFPGMLDKTGPLALDKDCLYKITHLLRRIALPVKVKLLVGPLPQGVPKEFTDTFILEKKFQEPLLVTCTLPLPTEDAKHEINCINMNSDVKLTKCRLGFDSENRLFKSQRLQAALSFCHRNVESWYREVRLVPNMETQNSHRCRRKDNCQGSMCNQCRPRIHDSDEHIQQMKNYANTDFSDKQIISKEVLEKFPRTKKWYKHLKIFQAGNENVNNGKYADLKDPMDGMEKVKSIERYKDMSKLIEEKFGKKSYNPVKKSASFMYSGKRMDLEETQEEDDSNPSLLKCQSLDFQLQSPEGQRSENSHSRIIRKPSNASSDSRSVRSNDIQLCILEEEKPIVPLKAPHRQSLRDLKTMNFHITEIAFEDAPLSQQQPKLKKNKPDLIPTLKKESTTTENSFITDRLCTEFHVKTKIQKKSGSKSNLLDGNDDFRSSVRLEDQRLKLPVSRKHSEPTPKNAFTRSVLVQVHEESLPKPKPPRTTGTVVVADYSHVADEVVEKNSEKGADENIYAEICEDECNNCDNIRKCECKRTKNCPEYCYVRLGSNGDSVSQSDSDDVIYNTLR
ncbi:uncharacterized protein LOC108734805 [Agrilus planipennis]|uniref:Uncharacterized protein LOC108734805 n=1 Tax=Agrilus planipennis TaxID=224129 RepID=A0A1W4WNE6_AGRPL|nr:uncharacterized protein LOC108734805 [Agrilus planipennis]